MTKFSNFHTPNLSASQHTLYVVVDSNPQVAGGYLLFHSRQFLFQHLDSIRKPTCIIFPNISEKYLKKFGYLKLVNSYRAECLGILKYVFLVNQFILEHISEIDNIVILNDNLQLVRHLQNQNNSTNFLLTEQIHVFELLQTYNKPFSFVWLRRSNPLIEPADALGRQFFSISEILFHRVEEFFEKSLFIPKLFQNPSALPLLWPNKLIRSIFHDGRTPLLLISPKLKFVEVQKIFIFLSNVRIEAIVGFPLFRKSLLERYFQKPFLKIPEITSENFFLPQIKKFKTTNAPFIFAKNKFLSYLEINI